MAAQLRAFALDGLPRMYDAAAGLFAFRLRRDGAAILREGLSRRYTAITLLGLRHEDPEAARSVLAGEQAGDVAARLAETASPQDSLGDLALIAWAAHTFGRRADEVWARIADLQPATQPHSTVEAAWTLSAAAAAAGAAPPELARDLSRRFLESFAPDARLFPHRLGSQTGGRGHVSCFADLVYPVMALAQYGEATGDHTAIACAVEGAKAMCQHQGPDGQWWWHYDYRTGRLIERYPVYAVHQDSMAPMALFAAAQASGFNFDGAVARGLRWLWQAPELGGNSLVDKPAGLIWRKVARREPAKLSRYIQAGASKLSRGFRAPGLDVIFPPQVIDFEDRPYHLGWVLYAWPRDRAAAWPRRSNGQG